MKVFHRNNIFVPFIFSSPLSPLPAVKPAVSKKWVNGMSLSKSATLLSENNTYPGFSKAPCWVSHPNSNYRQSPAARGWWKCWGHLENWEALFYTTFTCAFLSVRTAGPGQKFFLFVSLQRTISWCWDKTSNTPGSVLQCPSADKIQSIFVHFSLHRLLPKLYFYNYKLYNCNIVQCCSLLAIFTSLYSLTVSFSFTSVRDRLQKKDHQFIQ